VVILYYDLLATKPGTKDARSGAGYSLHPSSSTLLAPTANAGSLSIRFVRTGQKPQGLRESPSRSWMGELRMTVERETSSRNCILQYVGSVLLGSVNMIIADINGTLELVDTLRPQIVDTLFLLVFCLCSFAIARSRVLKVSRPAGLVLLGLGTLVVILLAADLRFFLPAPA